ncbi:hypothetical protein ASF58_22865 [Methylobacterium sp. Leaf125]|uniref:hypothetical protein n=1 Tax=Methylobacterium sp. Leaf125 TaxID=1736265 RepID=UPI0006F7990E|nr:hypothetical protein [Methylobacterium sp. Leaf125]KQQ39137.1 hypothetical protein ASF58_22865 [Methylobacterium sp. Leaf125]
MATTPHAHVIEHVPFHADPILAAIDHHDEAWSVWQSASDALVARRHVEMEGALARLLATPCATQFGALALLRHLRWHIQHDGITDAAVLDRAADLALYLRLDFPAAEPARARLAPALRLLCGLGEAVAALSLICGGLLVIGVATLV